MSSQESPHQVDRRKAPRFTVVLTVTLEDGREGRTRDVSASGVFFTAQGAFVEDTPVKFTIALEHADPGSVLHIACEGQVVRVEPSCRGVGVAVRISAYDFGEHPTAGVNPN